jgi:hypothetical protein
MHITAAAHRLHPDFGMCLRLGGFRSAKDLVKPV